MSWLVKGKNYGSCNCAGICPCTVDLPNSSPDGECRGADFYWITEGNFDGLDLAGVRLLNFFSLHGKPSDPGWRSGLIVDESASDEQARAVEQIWTGHAGGALAEMATLVTVYLGMERAHITFTDGKHPTVEANGRARFTYRAFTDSKGTPSTLNNTPFGGRELFIGTTEGEGDAFGISFKAAVGLASNFEMSG